MLSRSQFALFPRSQASAWERWAGVRTFHPLLMSAILAMCCVVPTFAFDETPSTPLTESGSGKRYEGLTLGEWRELMKSLDFQSTAAVQAVPGLLMLVRDRELPWYTRKQAALTLGRIGEPAEAAVPVLRALLVADDESEAASTTAWAAKALSLFGPLAAEATPELVLVLTDETRPHLERLSCVEALARIGGARAEAVSALMKFVQADIGHTHDAHELQSAAVDGLALVGPQASPAVPILIRLTRDDSGPLRKKSAVALGAIGPPSGIAAEALAELVLFDELPEVRESAAASLATIGDSGTEALRQLLTDQDITVRTLAAKSLGRLIRTDHPTTDALSAALQDTDPSVRIAAAESLWRTTRQAENITSTILDTLTSEDRQIRIRAYRLLLDLGPQATSAIPMLKRLTEHDRRDVRQTATKALNKLLASPPSEE